MSPRTLQNPSHVTNANILKPIGRMKERESHILKIGEDIPLPYLLYVYSKGLGYSPILDAVCRSACCNFFLMEEN